MLPTLRRKLQIAKKRGQMLHPPTAGSTPEKLWQTATVGAIGLPCTTGEAWDVTGSTKTTKGCSVYALRANDGPDELWATLPARLFAAETDHPETQPRLSGKSSELRLRDADEAFDAGTSSHKYFVLRTRVQEATQSETAWSTPSNSLLLILLELQKDDELATAMRLKLSGGTPKAGDTADWKVDPLGLLRC